MQRELQVFRFNSRRGFAFQRPADTPKPLRVKPIGIINIQPAQCVVAWIDGELARFPRASRPVLVSIACFVAKLRSFALEHGHWSAVAFFGTPYRDASELPLAFFQAFQVKLGSGYRFNAVSEARARHASVKSRGVWDIVETAEGAFFSVIAVFQVEHASLASRKLLFAKVLNWYDPVAMVCPMFGMPRLVDTDAMLNSSYVILTPAMIKFCWGSIVTHEGPQRVIYATK